MNASLLPTSEQTASVLRVLAHIFFRQTQQFQQQEKDDAKTEKEKNKKTKIDAHTSAPGVARGESHHASTRSNDSQTHHSLDMLLQLISQEEWKAMGELYLGVLGALCCLFDYSEIARRGQSSSFKHQENFSRNSEKISEGATSAVRIPVGFIHEKGPKQESERKVVKAGETTHDENDKDYEPPLVLDSLLKLHVLDACSLLVYFAVHVCRPTYTATCSPSSCCSVEEGEKREGENCLSRRSSSRVKSENDKQQKNCSSLSDHHLLSSSAVENWETLLKLCLLPFPVFQQHVLNLMCCSSKEDGEDDEDGDDPILVFSSTMNCDAKDRERRNIVPSSFASSSMSTRYECFEKLLLATNLWWTKAKEAAVHYWERKHKRKVLKVWAARAFRCVAAKQQLQRLVSQTQVPVASHEPRKVEENQPHNEDREKDGERKEEKNSKLGSEFFTAHLLRSQQQQEQEREQGTINQESDHKDLQQNLLSSSPDAALPESFFPQEEEKQRGLSRELKNSDSKNVEIVQEIPGGTHCVENQEAKENTGANTRDTNNALALLVVAPFFNRWKNFCFDMYWREDLRLRDQFVRSSVVAMNWRRERRRQFTRLHLLQWRLLVKSRVWVRTAKKVVERRRLSVAWKVWRRMYLLCYFRNTSLRPRILRSVFLTWKFRWVTHRRQSRALEMLIVPSSSSEICQRRWFTPTELAICCIPNLLFWSSINNVPATLYHHTFPSSPPLSYSVDGSWKGGDTREEKQWSPPTKKDLVVVVSAAAGVAASSYDDGDTSDSVVLMALKKQLLHFWWCRTFSLRFYKISTLRKSMLLWRLRYRAALLARAKLENDAQRRRRKMKQAFSIFSQHIVLVQQEKRRKEEMKEAVPSVGVTESSSFGELSSTANQSSQEGHPMVALSLLKSSSNGLDVVSRSVEKREEKEQQQRNPFAEVYRLRLVFQCFSWWKRRQSICLADRFRTRTLWRKWRYVFTVYQKVSSFQIQVGKKCLLLEAWKRWQRQYFVLQPARKILTRTVSLFRLRHTFFLWKERYRVAVKSTVFRQKADFFYTSVCLPRKALQRWKRRMKIRQDLQAADELHNVHLLRLAALHFNNYFFCLMRRRQRDEELACVLWGLMTSRKVMYHWRSAMECNQLHRANLFYGDCLLRRCFVQWWGKYFKSSVLRAKMIMVRGPTAVERMHQRTAERDDTGTHKIRENDRGSTYVGTTVSNPVTNNDSNDDSRLSSYDASMAIDTPTKEGSKQQQQRGPPPPAAGAGAWWLTGSEDETMTTTTRGATGLNASHGYLSDDRSRREETTAEEEEEEISAALRKPGSQYQCEPPYGRNYSNIDNNRSTGTRNKSRSGNYEKYLNDQKMNSLRIILPSQSSPMMNRSGMEDDNSMITKAKLFAVLGIPMATSSCAPSPTPATTSAAVASPVEDEAITLSEEDQEGGRRRPAAAAAAPTTCSTLQGVRGKRGDGEVLAKGGGREEMMVRSTDDSEDPRVVVVTLSPSSSSLEIER